MSENQITREYWFNHYALILAVINTAYWTFIFTAYLYRFGLLKP